MNGVIILNKPKGKTSHDMIYDMRRLLGMRRVGHTGTLDPDATGVLPICFGIATKAAEYITDGVKKYRAQMILGSSTTTQDSSGDIIEQRDVSVTHGQVKETISSFIGKTDQLPPMYSAIKVGGKKLYELARTGVEIERKTRSIEIFDIEIISVDLTDNIVIMDIACSKGTYIRTLCNDIGEKLGCLAHMGELVRLRSGRFGIEDSYTVEQLSELLQAGTIENAVIHVDEIFSEYRRIDLADDNEFRVKNGVAIRIGGIIDGEYYRVYGSNGEFLCLSRGNDMRLKMVKSFWV